MKFFHYFDFPRVGHFFIAFLLHFSEIWRVDLFQDRIKFINLPELHRIDRFLFWINFFSSSPCLNSVLNGQNHSPQTQLKTTRFLSLLFLKISFKTPKFDKRGHLGIAHKQKTLGYCIRRPHRWAFLSEWLVRKKNAFRTLR